MGNRQTSPSSANVITLGGNFILPFLKEQGMVKRLGRGSINNVIPLNNQLAILCSSSGAALWNFSNNEILWEIDSPATGGVLSPDGNILALSWHQDIYLWDLTSGQVRRRLEGHGGDVLSRSVGTIK